MLFVILSSTCLIYLCVVLIFAPLGRKIDQTNIRLAVINDIHTINNEYKDTELKKPLTQRFIKPILLKILNKISDIIPISNSNKLKKMIIMAGYSIQPANYNAIKFLVIIATGIGFMFFAIIRNSNFIIVGLFALFGMIFGLFLVRYVLHLKIRKRKELIRRQMPDVLDLLSVSVEAGLGFDMALAHVIKRLKGPLTDELVRTNREISLGKPRKDALKGLGVRTELEELISFASSVIQAEQQGISLKNVLVVQAKQIRQNRCQSVEERAKKAPVKIIIPLVLLIFPVLLIILLAPAVLNIIGMMDGF